MPTPLDMPKTINKIVRLPKELSDDLEAVAFELRKHDRSFSGNRCIIEAIKFWLHKVKEQLKEIDNDL